VQAIGVAKIRKMLVGVDVQGATTTIAEIDQHIGPGGLFPHVPGAVKMFWATGQGLPTWTGKTAHIPATAIPHLCFMDDPTQLQWNAQLNSIPGTWPKVRFTTQQEKDRTQTPPVFLGHWRPIIVWSADHPNRDRFQLVVNLTEFFQRVKNNNNYAEYIPPGLDPVRDRLGIDCYPGGQTNWTPVETVLGGPIAAAKQAGLRLVIPEMGLVVPTNPTKAQLQARADWYARFFDVCEASGIVDDVSVWCTTGDQSVGTGGFHLTPGDPAYKVVTDRMAA